jgi:hypothetical protein
MALWHLSVSSESQGQAVASRLAATTGPHLD